MTGWKLGMLKRVFFPFAKEERDIYINILHFVDLYI